MSASSDELPSGRARILIVSNRVWEKTSELDDYGDDERGNAIASAEFVPRSMNVLSKNAMAKEMSSKTVTAAGLGSGAELLVLSLGCMALLVYFAIYRMEEKSRHRAKVAELSAAVSLEALLPDVAPSTEVDSGTIRDAAPPESPGRSQFEQTSVATAHITDLVKSLVIYLQCVGSIAAASGARFSGLMSLLAGTASRMNVQVSGLECGGLSFLGRFIVFALLMPCLLSLIAGTYFALAWIQARRNKNSLQQVELMTMHLIRMQRNRRTMRQRATQLCAVLVYFFAFPLLQHALSIFAWQSAVGAPSPWLRVAPWIQVRLHKGPFTELLSFAILILVMLFACITAMIVRVARAVANQTPAVELAFLFAGYRPHAWWYEGVISLRRFSIAALASFLQVGSLMLAPLTGVIAGSALLLHVRVGAFRTLLANLSEVITLLGLALSAVLLSNLASAQTASDQSVSLGRQYGLELLFVLVNAVVIVFCVVGIVAPAVRLCALTVTRTRERLRARTARRQSYQVERL
eukprot:c19387_g1_i1.p1 GENE.c19387_g1_i1~~c19387_g1_i1.p1  ORF type:complete len:531 (+),score=73.09 c19387_g1_i1:31-1593(+)